jgi:hypothetical protein
MWIVVCKIEYSHITFNDDIPMHSKHLWQMCLGENSHNGEFNEQPYIFVASRILNKVWNFLVEYKKAMKFCKRVWCKEME